MHLKSKEFSKLERVVLRYEVHLCTCGNFEGGWEFFGGKIEEVETPQKALVREIKEKLDTEIKVGDLIDTIEYDYPNFHLSMDYFWCEIVSGDLVLKEHKAAKWLTKDELDEDERLSVNILFIRKIKEKMYWL